MGSLSLSEIVWMIFLVTSALGAVLKIVAMFLEQLKAFIVFCRRWKRGLFDK